MSALVVGDETRPAAAPDAEGVRRALLRDAACLQALFSAVDGRARGDDADKLIAEGIAVLAGNIWQGTWESLAGTYPAGILTAAGQINALARARMAVLDEAMGAPEDQHSFLVDQVGWLDTLANQVLAQLVGALREAT